MIASRVTLPTRAIRAAVRTSHGARPSFVTRATTEDKADAEAADLMGELGLGELSEVMAKAEGGAAVPAWVPDVPELKKALTFLAGTDGASEIGNKILVEKYGKTFYEQMGFTEWAELLNGRLAQLGFLAYCHHMFDGDVITQAAAFPNTLGVAIQIVAITAASLVPVVDKTAGYIPDNVQKPVMEFYEKNLSGVFPETSERVNGRAAMLGMAALVALGVVF
ncbi:carotene biosynthesis-related protein CBR [Pycnococcus provasolii]